MGIITAGKTILITTTTHKELKVKTTQQARGIKVIV